jgi:hypothetical protein
MNITKMTPLLVVDRIEPCLPLWARLGFTKTVEVPHGDGLGFAILAGAGLELMLQTRASLEADVVSVAARTGSALLYCDVASLAEARASIRASGGTILIDERSTPYGARELWAVDGSGQVLGFAQHER